GIFQHENRRLFFTRRYVADNREKFGMPRTAVDRKKKIETMLVTWPMASASGSPWALEVYAQESIEELVRWRNGEIEGGQWLDNGGIWHDAEGTWYASGFVAKALKMPPQRMYLLLRGPSGVCTRYKKVPHRNGKKDTFVHHEDEIGPLLRLKPAPIPDQ